MATHRLPKCVLITTRSFAGLIRFCNRGGFIAYREVIPSIYVDLQAQSSRTVQNEREHPEHYRNGDRRPNDEAEKEAGQREPGKTEQATN